MADRPNDSPAFRLRPRAEPKSYYSIRLEYSANPAAFTRERPRSAGSKRRSTSTKSSYSRSKQQSNKLTAAAAQSLLHHDSYAPSSLPSVKVENVVTKEDIEREERRKQLRREISQSITTDIMISPFIQRLSVDELKPLVVYDQNYITLKIEKVSLKQQAAGPGRSGAHVVCKCSRVCLDAEDDDNDKSAPLYVNVNLFDEYADEGLLKVGKILNVAKFMTGPNLPAMVRADIMGSDRWVHFDVIVRYDETDTASNSPPSMLHPTTATSPQSTSSTGATVSSESSKKPLIPFVSITNMIEQPVEPFVEMAPPSPPSLPNRDH